VLIGGAEPPPESALPADLAPLARLSMLKFDERALRASVNTLLEAIQEEFFEARARRLQEESLEEERSRLEERLRREEEHLRFERKHTWGMPSRGIPELAKAMRRVVGDVGSALGDLVVAAGSRLGLGYKRQPSTTKVATQGSKTPHQPVMLGLTAPRMCQAGSHFTTALVAYVAAAKDSATSKLMELGNPGYRTVMDMAPDRQLHWREGAPVTVRLSGEHLEFTPAEQTFEWNGRENVATFSVYVRETAPSTSVVLCFHVFLGSIQLAFIPISIVVAE
jgi:hypothetical protein